MYTYALLILCIEVHITRKQINFAEITRTTCKVDQTWSK
jgi:hypothetical protein